MTHGGRKKPTTSSYRETETQSEAADRGADSWVFHILYSQRKAQKPEKKVGAAPANNQGNIDIPGAHGESVLETADGTDRSSIGRNENVQIGDTFMPPQFANQTRETRDLKKWNFSRNLIMGQERRPEPEGNLVSWKKKIPHSVNQ